MNKPALISIANDVHCLKETLDEAIELRKGLPERRARLRSARRIALDIHNALDQLAEIDRED
jgi:hypothetical protein